MNQEQFIRKLSEKTGLSDDIIKKTVQGTMEIIKDELSKPAAKNAEIIVPGIGIIRIMKEK